jgi:hypothetical protein
VEELIMTETTVPTRDPIEQLIFLLSLGSTITRISESPLAGNGLPYCYVEVADPKGSHYILQAFGQEAVLLYELATKNMNRK